jgi:hypothetical protein
MFAIPPTISNLAGGLALGGSPASVGVFLSLVHACSLHARYV